CQEPGWVVAPRPGSGTASWRSIHAPWASPVARAPQPAPADHGLLPSSVRALPSRLQAPGTGTDIGASKTSAARPPLPRPVMSAFTADSGFLPLLVTWREGPSSAAQAKFAGGLTEPISTATTRMLTTAIQLRLAGVGNTHRSPVTRSGGAFGAGITRQH